MTHAQEVAQGRRFEFGANWATFLERLGDARILRAEDSLRRMLGAEDLIGRSFLDVGSGSGLFSLAARRLGAAVVSFDYDPASVACTNELKRRFYPDDPEWSVEEGSVLDQEYLSRLGQFDVVYSWGVLHHTGAMWQALSHVAPLVAERGKLFIAIYNDQGRASAVWRRVKKAYCVAPEPLRTGVLLAAYLRLWGPTILRDLLRGQPGRTLREYDSGAEGRGMSPWRDLVDWVGGYPFEVARPDDIFQFYHERNFRLDKLRTCGGGLGCNQFVFTRQ
jgi:2-polyprenyl-3-methyl-5-hydroxy-6-metoxy-1,4-benzoquinol methylase